MSKISIIMPLYNAEKYLEESLNSVLNQTFKDFELICINDASADATLEILKKYQNKDSRIAVLENEQRLGAAESRNKGLKNAKGKYIIFLDGDDIFDEEMLSLSCKTAEKTNANIVMFDSMHVVSEKIREKHTIYHSSNYYKKYCKDTFSIKEQKPFDWVRWTVAPWNKLFRLDFIHKNQLKFQTLSSSNDVYFVSAALLLSEKTIVLNDNRVMVYARDHDVPTRISYNRDPMCVYQAIKHLQNMLLERNLFAEYYKHFYYWAFFLLRITLDKLKKTEIKKKFYLFLQEQGIDNLIKAGEKYFNILNEDIKSWFYEYKEKDVVTEWFGNRTILYFHMWDKAEFVKNIFERCACEGKKVAIWGAGRNGYTALDFCSKNGLQVEAVIDSNKNKQGTYLFDCPILSFEDIEDDIQVILISAENIYDSVKTMVNDKDIEVMDLNIVLDM